MTQSTFTFKQSIIIEILPVPKSDNIRSMSSESDHLCGNSVSSDFDDQTGRIPAIWPERLDLGWLDLDRTSRPEWPAGLTDLARTTEFRSAGRTDLARKFRPDRRDPYRLAGIWPERPDSSGSGKIPASGLESGRCVRFRQFWPESDQPKFRRNSPNFGLYLRFWL
jgi:hypothetical protein